MALSGNLRAHSTNAGLLRFVSQVAPQQMQIEVYVRLREFPIFSPDLEGEHTPPVIGAFCRMIGRCDGLIISSLEYVRGIPGGLKNAIDWQVSREEIMHKPIALLHASHRGVIACLKHCARSWAP